MQVYLLNLYTIYYEPNGNLNNVLVGKIQIILIELFKICENNDATKIVFYIKFLKHHI